MIALNQCRRCDAEFWQDDMAETNRAEDAGLCPACAETHYVEYDYDVTTNGARFCGVVLPRDPRELHPTDAFYLRLEGLD